MINSDVKAVYATFPEGVRQACFVVRELIYAIADKTDEIGRIEETLKWGVPSYMTVEPKTGTTIRLSASREHVEKFTVSVHCQTTLIAEFREIYPDEFQYDKNRSLILDNRRALPMAELEHFIYQALTYHIN
ncbi:MAG: DUF1801 domain-containing protein [Arenicella sp.]